MERDEIDERLERLVQATADVGPRGGFEARVMRAIETDFVPRAAKRIVPFAAIVACAAIVWAVVAWRDADDALVTSDTVEMEW